MSLVPNLVKCDDGNWYRDPIFTGTTESGFSNWFICFDDNEPIELVIFAGSKTSTVLYEILSLFGGKLCNPRPARTCHRSRVHDKGDMAHAVSYFLDLKPNSPFPVALLHGNIEPCPIKENGKPLSGDCVLYGC